ncbi:MAG: EMC3/TMCO1 family protein [Candidatus Aenigmarchaeota archaeon]|nr:EMC3/TMCO1 family protein [Candidatus Aenigmarchaeota archaeon]
MVEAIFNMYLGILDGILFPLLMLKPVVAIFLISTIFALVSIAISILAVDRQRLKQLKERMLMLQEEAKAAQKRMDSESMSKFTKEAMGVNLQMLRLKSKSMLLIFIILVPFFPWLNHHYGGVVVARLPISLPLIGSGLGWILWYIFASLTMSYVIQRLLGIEYV